MHATDGGFEGRADGWSARKTDRISRAWIISAPPGPGKHLWATTLAIRMDPAAAIALSEQIRALAQTMGWPLPQ